MNCTVLIDYQNRTPIYLQIVTKIEEHVALGVLKPNEQIPSIRELAITLGINPNTVKKAYEILEQKNVIHTISTKGTFISNNASQVLEDAIEKELLSLKEHISNLQKLGLSKEEIRRRIEKSK